MSKLLLIDGDICVYRSACAAQKQFYRLFKWEDEETKVWKDFPVGIHKKDIEVPPGWELELQYEAEDVSHACYNAKHTLRRIMDACSAYFAENVICRIYISSEDKSNYRYEYAKTKGYKENRKAPKPIHYHAVRKYLIEKQGAIEVFGQEADDELGIVQTENSDVGDTYGVYAGNSCIVSIDKDLLMIPGWHYNFVKEEFTQVFPEKAAYNFYYQMLVGDTVDNIPGLPGIGPKKAKDILWGVGQGRDYPQDAIKDMHTAVEAAYNDNEYFLEQGRLLWIRRHRGEIWSGLNTVLGQD